LADPASAARDHRNFALQLPAHKPGPCTC
jgi:hypothetical protein